MTVTIVVAALTFLFVLGINTVYNWLIALSRRCDQAAADVDVQLRQRDALIPNLVAVVKGYAAHERSTLEAVAHARSAVMAAPAGAHLVQAELALGSALSRLFAVAEQYPELKASDSFLKLHDELGDLENKIAAARRFLNNVVAEYNTTRAQFPANILSQVFRFAPRDSGMVPKDSRGTIDTVPSIGF